MLLLALQPSISIWPAAGAGGIADDPVNVACEGAACQIKRYGSVNGQGIDVFKNEDIAAVALGVAVEVTSGRRKRVNIISDERLACVRPTVTVSVGGVSESLKA